MTFQHLLRMLAVAGAAALVLVGGGRARAEGGEGSVYSVQPASPSATEEPTPSSQAGEPAPEPGPVPLGRSRGAVLEAKNALAFRQIIARESSQQGLPFEIADAVVRVESRYNPAARHGPNIGLTQINARTAQSLGYSGSAAGLLEPETNLRYGLKYLAMAYRLAGGDMCGTILRFQAGHRATTMTRAAMSYCARVKTIIAASR